MGIYASGKYVPWGEELAEIYLKYPEEMCESLIHLAKHITLNAQLWAERFGVDLPTAPPIEVPAFTDITDTRIAELVAVGIAEFVRAVGE